MCFCCHKFRMADARVQRYVDLLTLLQAGKLVDAAKLADANHGKGLMPSSGNKKGEEDELDLELRDSRAAYMAELLASVEDAKKLVAKGDTGNVMSAHVLDFRAEIAGDFLKKALAQKKSIAGVGIDPEGIDNNPVSQHSAAMR